VGGLAAGVAPDATPLHEPFAPQRVEVSTHGVARDAELPFEILYRAGASSEEPEDLRARRARETQRGIRFRGPISHGPSIAVEPLLDK